MPSLCQHMLLLCTTQGGVPPVLSILLVCIGIALAFIYRIPRSQIDLNQLKSILGLKFTTVLFDNMSIKNLKLGAKLANKYYETEASGNITIKNVNSVARTGVDRISVGSITHSAPAMDFKLEI